MPQVWVATQGFVATRGGERVRVHVGETIHEGHWLLAVRSDAFRPQRVTFPVADAIPRPSAVTPPKPSKSGS